MEQSTQTTQNKYYERFIRLPEVMHRTGLSRSSIYLRISKETMPKPISLGGGRAIGWVESDIENYISTLIATSNKTAGKDE